MSLITHYEPDISEFHVGFEYELQNIENAQWGKTVQDVADFFNKYDDFIFADLVDLEGVRVKYIDQEDIESFGFKNYIPPVEYAHTWSMGDYTLRAWFNSKPSTIRIIHGGTNIFNGKIKNKSELKQVLQMIGVIENE